MAAMKKNPERPVLAGSTSQASCLKAVILRKGASTTDSLLAQCRAHPPGQEPPVAATIQFEWTGHPQTYSDDRYSASKFTNALPSYGHTIQFMCCFLLKH